MQRTNQLGISGYARYDLPIAIGRSVIHQPFIYALKRSSAGFLEYGLGYETRDGLQLRHITSGNVKPDYIEWLAQQIEHMGISLKVGEMSFIMNTPEYTLIPYETSILADMLRTLGGSERNPTFNIPQYTVSSKIARRFS